MIAYHRYDIPPNDELTPVVPVEVDPALREVVTAVCHSYPRWDWRRVRAEVQHHFPDVSRDSVRTVIAELGEVR